MCQVMNSLGTRVKEGVLVGGHAMPRTQCCVHVWGLWGLVSVTLRSPYFSFLAHSCPAVIIKLSIMTNMFYIGSARLSL